MGKSSMNGRFCDLKSFKGSGRYVYESCVGARNVAANEVLAVWRNMEKL